MTGKLAEVPSTTHRFISSPKGSFSSGYTNSRVLLCLLSARVYVGITKNKMSPSNSNFTRHITIPHGILIPTL